MRTLRYVRRAVAADAAESHKSRPRVANFDDLLALDAADLVNLYTPRTST